MGAYVSGSGNIYFGDRVGNDREARQDELQAYYDQQTKDQNNNQIQSQIDDLEKQTLRALREQLVEPNDIALNKLRLVNDQIKTLRSQKKA